MGDSLFDVTEIRRKLEVSEPTAAEPMAAADPAAPVPPRPAAPCSPAEVEKVESILASFLRETAKALPGAAPPGEPSSPGSAPAGPSPAPGRSTRQFLRDDPESLLEPTHAAETADPRLVALQLLEEAEIYRRFDQMGEAQQCVARAQQICPDDEEVVRRARALARAIHGGRS